jgi:cytochrome b involved in lipid metabolism
MKKFIISILMLILATSISFYFFKKNKPPPQTIQKSETQTKEEIRNTTSTQSQTAKTTSAIISAKPVKTYTMAEVVKHGSDPNNYVDCWTVIQDRVYNITQYADSLKHPGGEQIYQACGADATAMFETRPTGSKTPHSSEARKILEKYYIGDLKK